MSFFNVLGKIGKGAFSVVKTVGRVAVGTVSGIDLGGNNATSNSVPVKTEGTMVSANTTNGGILDSIVNSINRLNPHVSVDHTADIRNSNLPPWLLPAGIGLAAFMLLKSKK